jgi:hypothetical protein
LSIAPSLSIAHTTHNYTTLLHLRRLSTRRLPFPAPSSPFPQRRAPRAYPLGTGSCPHSLPLHRLSNLSNLSYFSYFSKPPRPSTLWRSRFPATSLETSSFCEYSPIGQLVQQRLCTFLVSTKRLVRPKLSPASPGPSPPTSSQPPDDSCRSRSALDA